MSTPLGTVLTAPRSHHDRPVPARQHDMQAHPQARNHRHRRRLPRVEPRRQVRARVVCTALLTPRARGRLVATVVRQLKHQPAALFEFNLTKDLDHPHIRRALKWFVVPLARLSRSA